MVKPRQRQKKKKGSKFYPLDRDSGASSIIVSCQWRPQKGGGKGKKSLRSVWHHEHGEPPFASANPWPTSAFRVHLTLLLFHCSVSRMVPSPPRAPYVIQTSNRDHLADKQTASYPTKLHQQKKKKTEIPPHLAFLHVMS